MRRPCVRMTAACARTSSGARPSDATASAYPRIMESGVRMSCDTPRIQFARAASFCSMRAEASVIRSPTSCRSPLRRSVDGRPSDRPSSASKIGATARCVRRRDTRYTVKKMARSTVKSSSTYSGRLRMAETGYVMPMCQYVPFGNPTTSRPSSRFQKKAG